MKHMLDLNYFMEDLIPFILTNSLSWIVCQGQCVGEVLQHLRASKLSSGVSENLTRKYQL